MNTRHSRLNYSNYSHDFLLKDHKSCIIWFIRTETTLFIPISLGVLFLMFLCVSQREEFSRYLELTVFNVFMMLTSSCGLMHEVIKKHFLSVRCKSFNLMIKPSCIDIEYLIMSLNLDWQNFCYCLKLGIGSGIRSMHY